MNLIPWLFLFAGAALLWLPDRFRPLSYALLIAGYGAATLNGHLDFPALVPVLLLGLSAVLIQREHWIRAAGFVLFTLTATVLALHRAPGFENLEVITSDVLSEGAAPASLWLNLDKPLVGFWLMLFLPWCLAGPHTKHPVIQTALALAGTVSVCLGLGFITDSITWAPKWPEWGWLWALNNLLLVSMAEEAFFRGFVQGGMERLWGHKRYGKTLALVLAALLFGLAYHRGGMVWISLATVAGIGYGLAWRAGGLRSAVATHFGLNLIHFSLFTYPILASAT